MITPRLVDCCFTSTETVGLLGTGTQDAHLDFLTAPELCWADARQTAVTAMQGKQLRKLTL